MTSQTSVVSKLLGGLSAGSFRESYWDQRYFLRHGDVGDLVGSVLPHECQDMDALLEVYKAPVMVLGRAVLTESQGYTDRVLVSAAEARAWYSRGGALELDCLDAYLPPLRQLADQLRRELALPEGTFGKAIAYLSTGGGGLTPHFDAYANFVFQVRGTKTWWLQDNHAVRAPMEHYSLHEYPMVPAELRSYVTGSMPQDYAASATPIELRPGSVMFLPRGMWHSTAASGDSISVNVTFSVPSWLDLLLAEVRSVLIRDWRWREHALTAGDPRTVDAARAHLSRLLTDLAPRIANLRPDSILARHTAPHDNYQLAQAAQHEILGMAGWLMNQP